MSETPRMETVLDAHIEVGGVLTDEGQWIKYVCSCGATGGDHTWHRAHVAAALREAGYVHRDEVAGARGAVAERLIGTPEWDDPPRGFPVVRAGCAARAADAALAAVIEHLTADTEPDDGCGA